MCRKRTSDRGERRGEACAHMVHAAVAAAAAYFAWRVAASVPSSTSSRSSSLHTSAFFCDLSVSETKPHNLSLPPGSKLKKIVNFSNRFLDACLIKESDVVDCFDNGAQLLVNAAHSF